MKKISTMFVALILVAGIVSVAKSTDIDSSSSDSSATASGTWTLNNDLKVTNVLNINAGELDASNKTIELAGSDTPFLVSGTFTPSNSTVKYTSPDDTNITAANYYHLDLIDPPLETRNQKPVTSNQKELLQNLEKLKIKEIEPDKFSFKSLSGDLIEIGEQRHSPPQPYLKLNRWDGEVSLKVHIPYAIDGQKSLTNNRLRWVNHRYDVDFYPKEPEEIKELDPDGKYHTFTINDEGGVEFDITLKEKPESNVFTFPIETQGLKFYYQPPLHPEHPTWADRDSDGKPDSFRPENVVGSYAVYHESKSGDYTQLGGKNYRAGKAFHIYRPKVNDTNGDWIWGEMNIDEKKGILSVSVEQDWLDNAVYPVVIDPDFGYKTSGSTSMQEYNTIYGSSYNSGACGAATVDSLTAYVWPDYTTIEVSFAIYEKTGYGTGDRVGHTGDCYYDSGPHWQTFDVTEPTSPSITPNTDYWLLLWSKSPETNFFYYDETGGTGFKKDQPYGTWPASLSGSGRDYRFSIYCTYTVDTTSPTSSATSPPYAKAVFTVNWSGSDPGGFGLKNYDVQYKVDAGAWTNWLTATTATSGNFGSGGVPVTLVSGKTYYFQTRARDNAGNVEAYPGGIGTITLSMIPLHRPHRRPHPLTPRRSSR